MPGNDLERELAYTLIDAIEKKLLTERGGLDEHSLLMNVQNKNTDEKIQLVHEYITRKGGIDKVAQKLSKEFKMLVEAFPIKPTLKQNDFTKEIGKNPNLRIADYFDKFYNAGSFHEDFDKIKQQLTSKGVQLDKGHFKRGLDKIIHQYPDQVTVQKLDELHTLVKENTKDNDLLVYLTAYACQKPQKELVHLQSIKKLEITKQLYQEEAKRVGHIMGMRGDAGFKLADNLATANFTVEANLSNFTLDYLNEKLRLYDVPKGEEKEWGAVKKAFESAKRELSLPVTTRAQLVHKRIQERPPELVHLGDSWWGGINAHAIGVTFYGDYMVVCNRGYLGKGADCTEIYKIDPRKISESHLNTLQSIPSDPRSILDIIDAIKKTAGSPDPVATLPSSPQKFGNCNYVNKRSSIEAMLCLVKLDQEGKLNNEAIKAYATDPSTAKANRQPYKKFTNHCRDSEVKRIIANMNTFKDDSKALALYVNLALDIVRGRGLYTSSKITPDEYRRSQELIGAVGLYYSSPQLNGLITTANLSAYQELKKTYEKPWVAPRPREPEGKFERFENNINREIEAIERVAANGGNLTLRIKLSIRSLNSALNFLDDDMRHSPEAFNSAKRLMEKIAQHYPRDNPEKLGDEHKNFLQLERLYLLQPAVQKTVQTKLADQAVPEVVDKKMQTQRADKPDEKMKPADHLKALKDFDKKLPNILQNLQNKNLFEKIPPVDTLKALDKKSPDERIQPVEALKDLDKKSPNEKKNPKNLCYFQNNPYSNPNEKGKPVEALKDLANKIPNQKFDEKLDLEEKLEKSKIQPIKKNLK